MPLNFRNNKSDGAKLRLHRATNIYFRIFTDIKNCCHKPNSVVISMTNKCHYSIASQIQLI